MGEVPKIGDRWDDYSKALSGRRPELPPGVVPEGLQIMIERCWHDDPLSRPTPSEIMHYLKRIDSDGVYIPAPTTAGMGFLVHVLGFISYALSWLGQPLLPVQKFMKFRKLLYSLFSWRMLGLSEEPDEKVAAIDWLYLWERRGMSELGVRFHAATMQHSRLALTNELHIDVKKKLLEEFVEPLLEAGVWMPYVCRKSEVIIRQMSDTKHRWALRRHLVVLCILHRVRIEMDYSPLFKELLFRWYVLGHMVRILGIPDCSLFWYFDISPAIESPLFLMRFIGARAHPLWYWRLLFAYFVGNGEGFKYWVVLQLALSVFRNYRAYKQADFRPPSL